MDQKTINQNNQSEPQQLDLESFAFRLSGMDFEASKERIQPLESTPAQKRFFGYSLALHGLLALSVLTAAITQPPKQAKVETVSFEIIDHKAGAVATSTAEPSASSGVDAAAKVAEELVVQPEPAKLAPAQARKSVAKSAAPKAKAPSIVTVKESPVVVPETLDDISTPELDQQAQADAASTDRLDEKEIDNNLSAAAISHEDVQKTQNEFDQSINSENEKSLAAMSALEKKNQQEADRIAKLNAAQRQQDQNAIASLAAAEAAQVAAQVAKEKAAGEAAAAKAAADARAAQEAQAAANAKAAAAALAAQKALAKEQGQGAGDGQGQSQGTLVKGAAGEGSPNAGSNPSAGSVRDLEDLRQMPGNPRPEYDVQDRMDRKNGTVVFWAYISKDGSTSKFKLIQSSGHRSLDGKTLAALKRWKFYPGQEGWVELPFKWDIEGGVQEKPTLLRRLNK